MLQIFMSLKNKPKRFSLKVDMGTPTDCVMNKIGENRSKELKVKLKMQCGTGTPFDIFQIEDFGKNIMSNQVNINRVKPN